MHLKPIAWIALLLCWAGDLSGAGRPCPPEAVPGAHELVETTCREVRRELARVTGATVKTSTRPFVDPRFECTREGCVVELTGSFSALEGKPSPDSWLGEYLEKKGWARTLSHDADGPDGTVYALHRPGALCIVEGRWNHWHDDNGEGHLDDAYTVTLSCGGADRTAPRPPE